MTVYSFGSFDSFGSLGDGDGGSLELEFVDDINGDSRSPRSDPLVFGSHMMTLMMTND